MLIIKPISEFFEEQGLSFLNSDVLKQINDKAKLGGDRKLPDGSKPRHYDDVG